MFEKLDLILKPSARCGLQKQLSDSCPGERAMSAASHMELMMTTTGQTTFLTGRDLRSQRWGEHFQDLSGWCQPNKSADTLARQLDEQLNTPIISAQDEFDFGVRSSEERFGTLVSEMECDPWEVTSLTSTASLTNTIMPPHTQKELWDTVNVWLSSNSPEHNPEFEEVISPPPLSSSSSDFNNSDKRQIVKANGDFLLSQSPVEYHQIKTEEPSINFSPYLTTVASPEDQFNETSNNNNNNNNNYYLDLTPYVKEKPVIKQLVTSVIKNETGNTLIKNETNGGTYNTFYCRPLKRECSFDLSSLLKSEEPFINEIDSEASCNLSPDCKHTTSSPIVISDKDEDVVAAEEVVVTTEDSHLVKQEDSITTTTTPLSYGNTIKTEMDPAASVRCCNNNIINSNNNNSNMLQQHQREPFKPSPPASQETEKNIGRPKLKLDIDAALMSTHTESLDTPEVLRPLVDGIDGFNLLSYVCDDGAINLLSAPTPSSSVSDQQASSSSSTMTSVAPHQEKKRGVGRPPGRYQPRGGKKGRKIKEETVEEEPPKLPELTPSGRPKRKSAESFKSSIKQRRITTDTDDSVSLSSIDTGANSDDSDESFSTKSRRGRKRKLSKSSSKSSSISRKRKTSDSDLDSVFSGTDRYRELRDRNNEASRRSRLNRKSREMEMRDQALQLEKDNRLLKIKADEMERLVKKLRENLMQLVLNK